MKRLVIYYFCLSLPVLAADVQFSGFGSLTAMANDSQVLGFRNDVSLNDGIYENQWSFSSNSNLGFQVDVGINYQWDVAAQWVLMELDDEDFNGFTRMAFLRYMPNQSWAIRAGRIPVDLFELSEYRDVGIAFPWVKVPTEVYGFIPFRNLDGADLTYLSDIDDWHLEASLSYGSTEAEVTSSTDRPIKFHQLTGISMTLSAQSWSATVRHTEAQVARNNESTLFVLDSINTLTPIWPDAPSFANQMNFSHHDARYTSVFATYDWGAFRVSAEIAEVDSSSLLIDELYNGYFNLSYKKGDHTFYWLWSFAKSDEYIFSETLPDLPQVEQVILLIEEVNTFYRANQISQSIGWRWDIKDNLAMKLQLQTTNVNAKGNGLWSTKNDFRVLTPSESVNIAMLNLSFNF